MSIFKGPDRRAVHSALSEQYGAFCVLTGVAGLSQGEETVDASGVAHPTEPLRCFTGHVKIRLSPGSRGDGRTHTGQGEPGRRVTPCLSPEMIGFRDPLPVVHGP